MKINVPQMLEAVHDALDESVKDIVRMNTADHMRQGIMPIRISGRSARMLIQALQHWKVFSDSLDKKVPSLKIGQTGKR